MGTAAVQDVKGVFFIVASETLLAVVNAIVKFVRAWPADRIMVVRYTVDFVLCLSLCKVLKFQTPDRAVAARLFLRGFTYLAFIVFVWAAFRSCLPLGDVVTLTQTWWSIFLVIFARVCFQEKIPRLWPLQFVLCFAGAMLVNKPLAPGRGCSPGAALLPMAAAFFGALMNLASRSVKEVPAPVVSIFTDIVVVTVALGYMCLTSQEPRLPLSDFFSSSFLLVIVSAVFGWLGLIAT